MYASLAAAGASALYDLYKSVTGSSKTSDTSSTASAFPSTSSASTSVGTTSAVGAVGSADTGGSKFSDALNKLFTDLQASSSASATGTDPTSTIADDLQSISKGLKSAGGHGAHRHGPAAIGSADPAAPDGTTTGTTTGTSNPFQGLASSLVAYAKTQGLGASASTSLTA